MSDAYLGAYGSDMCRYCFCVILDGDAFSPWSSTWPAAVFSWLDTHAVTVPFWGLVPKADVGSVTDATHAQFACG